MESNNFVFMTDKNNLWLIEIHWNNLKNIYGDDFSMFVGLTSRDLMSVKGFFSKKNIVYRSGELQLSEYQFNSNLPSRIHLAAYLRLFTFDMFPELMHSNFIYLDTDAFIKRKISLDIFKKNTAVIDSLYLNIKDGITFLREVIKIDSIFLDIKEIIENDNFFNSGVIYVVDSYKFNEYLNKIIYAIEKRGNLLKVDDQTLLNLFNNNDVDVLKDMNYNDQVFRFNCLNLIETTYVVHFASHLKPWTLNFSFLIFKFKLKKIYIKYSYFNKYKVYWKYLELNN